MCCPDANRLLISNIFILHILQVKSCNWFVHQVSTNFYIPGMCSWNWYMTTSKYARIKGVSSWFVQRVSTNFYVLVCDDFEFLQESGGVSSWIVPVQCIILYSFSLHEFTIQVLIKVFNEVISTWDHMSYFLFSPPGFLGKYIRHIYCPLNSMGFLVLS